MKQQKRLRYVRLWDCHFPRSETEKQAQGADSYFRASRQSRLHFQRTGLSWLCMLNESGHNIISFVAHNAARVEVHRHHCFQIVASINGTFVGTIDGQAYPRKTGFIINQNIVHSCQAGQASVIVFFIDAGSDHGGQLRTLLMNQPFLDLDGFLTQAQAQRIRAEGNQHLPKAELKNSPTKFLRAFCQRTCHQQKPRLTSASARRSGS